MVIKQIKPFSCYRKHWLRSGLKRTKIQEYSNIPQALTHEHYGLDFTGIQDCFNHLEPSKSIRCDAKALQEKPHNHSHEVRVESEPARLLRRGTK